VLVESTRPRGYCLHSYNIKEFVFVSQKSKESIPFINEEQENKKKGCPHPWTPLIPRISTHKVQVFKCSGKCGISF